MLRLIGLTVALLPSLALAAPAYVGDWAALGLPCEDAIVLRTDALEGAENECLFTDVQRDGSEFVIQATCQGEGMDPEHWSLFVDVHDNDTLTLTDAGGAPILYHRCSP
jgi:hypothetical protein